MSLREWKVSVEDKITKKKDVIHYFMFQWAVETDVKNQVERIYPKYKVTSTTLRYGGFNK